MTIDLSKRRDAADLVDSIWEARRAERRDLLPQLLPLLQHEVPTVREEVISLVFVKWREISARDRLERVLREDTDPGVRASAVGALAILSEPASRQRDIAMLRDVVLDRREAEEIRKAAYEGLTMLLHGHTSLIDDATDLDEDMDIDWVKSL